MECTRQSLLVTAFFKSQSDKAFHSLQAMNFLSHPDSRSPVFIPSTTIPPHVLGIHSFTCPYASVPYSLSSKFSSCFISFPTHFFYVTKPCTHWFCYFKTAALNPVRYSMYPLLRSMRAVIGAGISQAVFLVPDGLTHESHGAGDASLSAVSHGSPLGW